MELAHPDNRRWILLAALSVVAIVLLAGVLLTAGVVHYLNATDYPGATILSGDDMVKVWPFPIFRRTNSYLTTDPFPVVYRWYSNGFNLGAEMYALNTCIQMAKNFNDYYIFERHMSVMLCDTPRGRMIYVIRTLTLRLKQ
jgi:hypothetical protein